MLLDSTKYVNFETRHIGSLEWNKQRTRPRLTMKDGTEYEITVPGKTVDELKNLTLGDWKKIAEELNRILIEKEILDGGEDAPVNARALDQLMVNKTGVTFAGTMHKHTDGPHDTKKRFKEIKTLSKKLIPSTTPVKTPSSVDPAGPPKPPKAPKPAGAPVNTAGAIKALEKVGGVEEDLLNKIVAEIDADIVKTSRNFMKRDGSISDWKGLAIDLTEGNAKADAIFNDNEGEIPNAKKAEVQQKIQAVYVAKSVETVVNSVASEAIKAIKKQKNWTTKKPEDLIEKCFTDDLFPLFQPCIEGDEFIEPVKDRLKVELTESKIKGIIRSRLQALLTAEAAQPVSAAKSYWNMGVNAFKTVKNGIQTISNVVNGNDDDDDSDEDD